MRNLIERLNCFLSYFVYFPICELFRIAFRILFRKKNYKLKIRFGISKNCLQISKSCFVSSVMMIDWLAVISYFGDISYFEDFSYTFCIKFRMISYFDMSGFLMLAIFAKFQIRRSFKTL